MPHAACVWTGRSGSERRYWQIKLSCLSHLGLLWAFAEKAIIPLGFPHCPASTQGLGALIAQKCRAQAILLSHGGNWDVQQSLCCCLPLGNPSQGTPAPGASASCCTLPFYCSFPPVQSAAVSPKRTGMQLEEAGHQRMCLLLWFAAWPHQPLWGWGSWGQQAPISGVGLQSRNASLRFVSL